MVCTINVHRLNSLINDKDSFIGFQKQGWKIYHW